MNQQIQVTSTNQRAPRQPAPEPTRTNARRDRQPNNAVNPSHSGFTALAQGGKRRAAGRAGYRER
jgi:hypothetical protein